MQASVDDPCIHGTTSKIAEFIVSIKPEEIPEDAIRFAKGAIIDCFASMIAAVPNEVTEKISSLVRSEGCKPIAGVIGSGFKTSVMNAALANGTIGHVLDLDDTNDSMRGHPSIPVVPVVFAFGEQLRSKGMDVLSAYLVGFEIEAKIGRGVNLEHYERGWHTTLTLGSIGAVAASAKILDLNSHQTSMALGIASSLSSGLRANFGSMTKSFHAGKAAYNGALAAKLAQQGFTANGNILEAEEGFCDLFCGKDNCDFEKMVQNLGDPFDIVVPGVAIKTYPSCSLTHTAIDKILELKKDRGLKAEDVAEVKCGVGYRCANTLPYHKPRTGFEGKFSMEYCIAISLKKGRADIDDFPNSEIHDSDVKSLMEKIEVYTHPELVDRESVDRDFTLIEIFLKNGEKISLRGEQPKGHPPNLLSWDEILQKFRKCGKRAFEDRTVDQSLSLLERLEHVPAVTSIMDLLCKI
jgi:2-methylcitrate dehydratase PrpD